MSAKNSPARPSDDTDDDPDHRDLHTHRGVEAVNADADGPSPLSPLDGDDVADAQLDADRAHWLPTSELSDQEREAYLACEVEGVAPSDLATLPEISRSASTIRTQLSRARRKVEEATR